MGEREENKLMQWGLGGALWHIEHLIDVCGPDDDERKKRLLEFHDMLCLWLDELHQAGMKWLP